ncbi:MAG: hypothetical protein VX899_10150 [Myxococcota bacterium]|nr:hypothetical protein [Myxococcota bacterium]
METPELDKLGFVRVPAAPGRPEQWLQCNQCDKRERFWIAEQRVHCSCGAAYDHAAVGEHQVPAAELQWVAFKDGPVSLSEVELDPKRIAVVVAILAALVAVVVKLLL